VFDRTALRERGAALTYLRHYTIRLRHSERLRYQFARALLAAIPFGLLAFAIFLARS